MNPSRHSRKTRLLDRLLEPKVQALITLFIAISFSISVFIATVIPYIQQHVLCLLGGGCILSVSSHEIKLTSCFNQYGIYMKPSIRYPVSIFLKDNVIPFLTFSLTSIDSMLTSFNINGVITDLNILDPKPSLYSNFVRIDYLYQKNSKLVTIEVSIAKVPYISILSKSPILTVGLQFGGIISSYSWNKHTLNVTFVNTLLNFMASLVLRSSCSINNVEKNLPTTLVIETSGEKRCNITIAHVNVSFDYYVLKFNKQKNNTMYPTVEPILVEVKSKSFVTLMKISSYLYFIIPYSIYLVALIASIALVIKIVLKSKEDEVTQRRTFYSFIFVMALFGGLTSHWWDSIQTWIFSGQSPNAIQAYLYTYYQMKYIQLRQIPHILNYAGYTYPLPWLIYLLYPLKLILSAFHLLEHSFIAFQSPHSFFHLYYDYVYLYPETLLVSISSSMYWALFAILTYEMIALFKNEEMLKSYALFMYTPYAVAISFVWKMFETLFMPILIQILMLINNALLKRHTDTKTWIVLGFLISIFVTKAYPAIIILGLLLPYYRYVKREMLVTLISLVITSLIVILPIVTELGFKKYFLTTFLYQSTRVPSVINVFNSILYPTLPYRVGLMLRKIDLIILGAVLLWYIIVIYYSYKNRKYNIKSKDTVFTHAISSSVALFSIYLIFSPVVSPQNYFFLVFLGFYLIEISNDLNVKRVVLALSIFLFIFVLFVYPGFTFFGYPLGELVGILPQTSYLLWFMFLISFVGRIISAVLYPLMLTMLIILSYASISLINKNCKNDQIRE